MKLLVCAGEGGATIAGQTAKAILELPGSCLNLGSEQPNPFCRDPTPLSATLEERVDVSAGSYLLRVERYPARRTPCGHPLHDGLPRQRGCGKKAGMSKRDAGVCGLRGGTYGDAP